MTTRTHDDLAHMLKITPDHLATMAIHLDLADVSSARAYTSVEVRQIMLHAGHPVAHSYEVTRDQMLWRTRLSASYLLTLARRAGVDMRRANGRVFYCKDDYPRIWHEMSDRTRSKAIFARSGRRFRDINSSYVRAMARW